MMNERKIDICITYIEIQNIYGVNMYVWHEDINSHDLLHINILVHISHICIFIDRQRVAPEV